MAAWSAACSNLLTSNQGLHEFIVRLNKDRKRTMPYSIVCSCGATVSVTTSQAGGTCTCACGVTNAVPRLSELRLSAGEAPHPISGAERIAGIVARSELPDRDTCTSCDANTDNTVWFAVFCERKRTSGGNDNTFVYYMLFGWIAILASAIRPPRSKTHGTDVVVDVPMRICPTCLTAIESTKSQRKLRGLVRRVPACSDLLDSYPNASIMPNCRG